MRKHTAYTLDDNIIKKFNQITKEKAINKSALIELLIKKWLKENEKM